VKLVLYMRAQLVADVLLIVLSMSSLGQYSRKQINIPRRHHHICEQLAQFPLHEKVLRCMDELALMRVVGPIRDLGDFIPLNIVVGIISSVTPCKT
jgi:hypothetical protein